MQPRHVAAILLVIGAVCLGGAVFGHSWWSESEGGRSIGLGLIGIEECRDDKCESASYGPLLEDTEGSERGELLRHVWLGRVAFGTGATAACLAIAALLGMLSGSAVARTFAGLSIPVVFLACAIAIYYSANPPSGLEKLGFGGSFFAYWGGLLATISGQIVLLNVHMPPRSGPPPSHYPPPQYPPPQYPPQNR